MSQQTIAVIGAGNGGQAMAAHFALLGHKVRLYNRSLYKIQPIVSTREIRLIDKINGLATIDLITDNIELVLDGANIVMITTTANAHCEIAAKAAPFFQENQIIVLNPGRTLGAIEFANEVKKHSDKNIMIAEAQSLIYACRAELPGLVKIIGIKDKVLLSAYTSNNNDYIIEILNNIFPCFEKANNVLHTSLENIGAILHPVIVLFNAAAIERRNLFYFYKDITPLIADFLERLDQERINIGKAFNIELKPIANWISYAYPNVVGENLYEKICKNPSYYAIRSPDRIDSRFISEDVPTGLVPLSQLGDFAGVNTSLMKSIVNICSKLLNVDFWHTGRNMKKLGLHKKTFNKFIKSL